MGKKNVVLSPQIRIYTRQTLNNGQDKLLDAVASLRDQHLNILLCWAELSQEVNQITDTANAQGIYAEKFAASIIAHDGKKKRADSTTFGGDSQ